MESSRQLLVAPRCLQNRVLELMDREIEYARRGEPAYLGVKINSLTDKTIIDRLMDASRAGVRIDLVVRGICCLLPGIPGATENIRVISIVGRFLEHSRIYIFGTGDRQAVYIASADFMTRNTLRRVEVAAPVLDPGSPEFDPGAAESFAGSIQNTVEKMQAGEENITEEEEQTSSNEVSEEKWVEPYEYFGVDNSIDLLPKLKENGVTRLEAAPIVFNENTGEVRTLSNAEPFILSMVDGEVSTFSSSFDRYWEGEFLETEAFTLTFTGGKAAYNAYYWSIEGTNDTTYASGFTDHEEFDDGILYKDNFRIIPEQFHKYIIMDARIGDFLGLEVKRVLLK